MHILIPAYVLLALAGWSALAAPLPKPEGDIELAQRQSLSSSILTGRQTINLGALGPGPEAGPGLEAGPGPEVFPDDLPTTTMDCDPEDKGRHHKDDNHKDDHDNSNNNNVNGNNPNNFVYANLATPVLPTIARRRIRGSTSRHRKPKTPSIFERDDPSTTKVSNNHDRIADAVVNYLKQRAASRKRAMKPKTSRGTN
jgi:hypothetical protein